MTGDSSGFGSGDDMGDGEGGVVVTASLAVAVTALLFAFFTTILVLGMLYVLIRVKADVRKLRAASGALARAENGSSSSRLMAVNRLEHPPDRPDEKEVEMDQNPLPQPSPPSPTVPRVTTPPQDIPQLQQPPHGPTSTGPDLEPVETIRSASPRDNYDNVKLSSSLLPPELRTAENLEGRPLKLEEAIQLEELERQSYEEVEMSLKRKEEAVAAVRGPLGSPGGQGAAGLMGPGSDDEYTNPADALKTSNVTLKETNPKQEKEEGRKFKVEGEEHIPGVYTAVFDQLPSGEKEVITKQQHKTVGGGRGSSDTSPLVGRKSGGGGGGSGGEEERGGGGGGKVNVCGYEDMSEELFNAASSAPCQDSSPLSDMALSPRERKTELTKTLSQPPHASTRREARKEMVEVNPNSRKPVTLSSGRRKKMKQQDTETEGGGRESTDDGPGSKSAGSSPTSSSTTAGREAVFSVESEPGEQDSYAMVDMTAKHRYRAESDSMKREGSGAPKHYTVKEQPPGETGEEVPPQTVVA